MLQVSFNLIIYFLDLSFNKKKPVLQQFLPNSNQPYASILKTISMDIAHKKQTFRLETQKNSFFNR